MKIAVNKCFGGFSLSEEALQYLEAVHGVKIYESWDELQNGRVDGELWSLRDSKFSRQIA
jgi:hypothetical protein